MEDYIVPLCPTCRAILVQDWCWHCRKIVRTKPTPTEPPKMGFEKQRIVTTGYGKAGYFDIDGKTVWTASAVERQWLAELAIAIRGGTVRAWKWQPDPVPVHYRNGRTACTRTYRPDAWVDWLEEGEVTYEIKFGRIETRSGNNIVAFCLSYPDRKMVLVWKGRPPRSGTTKRQWDKIQPHIDHVWYLK